MEENYSKIKYNFHLKTETFGDKSKYTILSAFIDFGVRGT